MPTDECPSQRCELYESANLPGALDRCMVEHLSITDSRMFVIYGEAVLELRVTDGTLADALAFTVESKGFSRRASDSDPATVMADFCGDLVAATDTTCRETH